MMALKQENVTAFPELPLEEWEDTKDTLHRYLQIGGKIRLAQMPMVNHWWQVTYYVSTRGLTTGPIPAGLRTFELCFDFQAHELMITVSSGERSAFSLRDGMSVAAFHSELTRRLRDLDLDVPVPTRPLDLEPDIPFAEDQTHARYDAEYVNRFWRTLVQADRILQQFRGRFIGKSSPVQLFWHSFDLAMTRFSGKRVELPDDTDLVTREAYSHEVISFGFWAGSGDVREPAFYSYTAPEPAGLRNQPLRPDAAYWKPAGAGSLALLSYDVVRTHSDPDAVLLDFLESSYQAGVNVAGWDDEEFRK